MTTSLVKNIPAKRVNVVSVKLVRESSCKRQVLLDKFRQIILDTFRHFYPRIVLRFFMR